MDGGEKRSYHKRDRLRQLQAFCEAARRKSITDAADFLGITQPAVSLQVRELENELQAVLFDRAGPRITLTPAGEHLYELAEPLVAGMDCLYAGFVERLEEVGTGRIHLAASHAGAAFVLPPYLRRFRELYPGIRLRVTNCLLGEGVALLLADEVEFVLGTNDPFPHDVLEYRELFRYDLVLITGLDHPLAGRESVSPEEAAECSAVIPYPGTYSVQGGETAARQFGLDARSAIEVGGWGAVKRHVEAGLGVAVVPGICISETDRLSIIPLGEYFPSRSYGVFRRRDKLMAPAARRLLRLMEPAGDVPRGTVSDRQGMNGTAVRVPGSASASSVRG